ncbi:MAG: hypothetical protein EZS28_018189, partial [Streblomastix strix]
MEQSPYAVFYSGIPQEVGQEEFSTFAKSFGPVRKLIYPPAKEGLLRIAHVIYENERGYNDAVKSSNYRRTIQGKIIRIQLDRSRNPHFSTSEQRYQPKQYQTPSSPQIEHSNSHVQQLLPEQQSQSLPLANTQPSEEPEAPTQSKKKRKKKKKQGTSTLLGSAQDIDGDNDDEDDTAQHKKMDTSQKGSLADAQPSAVDTPPSQDEQQKATAYQYERNFTYSSSQPYTSETSGDAPPSSAQNTADTQPPFSNKSSLLTQNTLPPPPPRQIQQQQQQYIQSYAPTNMNQQTFQFMAFPFPMQQIPNQSNATSASQSNPIRTLPLPPATNSTLQQGQSAPIVSQQQQFPTQTSEQRLNTQQQSISPLPPIPNNQIMNNMNMNIPYLQGYNQAYNQQTIQLSEPVISIDNKQQPSLLPPLQQYNYPIDPSSSTQQYPLPPGLISTDQLQIQQSQQSSSNQQQQQQQQQIQSSFSLPPPPPPPSIPNITNAFIDGKQIVPEQILFTQNEYTTQRVINQDIYTGSNSISISSEQQYQQDQYNAQNQVPQPLYTQQQQQQQQQYNTQIQNEQSTESDTNKQKKKRNKNKSKNKGKDDVEDNNNNNTNISSVVSASQQQAILQSNGQNINISAGQGLTYSQALQTQSSSSSQSGYTNQSSTNKQQSDKEQPRSKSIKESINDLESKNSILSSNDHEQKKRNKKDKQQEKRRRKKKNNEDEDKEEDDDDEADNEADDEQEQNKEIDEVLNEQEIEQGKFNRKGKDQNKQNSCELTLEGLSDDTTEQSLHRVLEQYGKIILCQVKIVDAIHKVGFIEFSNPQSAQKAAEQLKSGKLEIDGVKVGVRVEEEFGIAGAQKEKRRKKYLEKKKEKELEKEKEQERKERMKEKYQRKKEREEQEKNRDNNNNNNNEQDNNEQSKPVQSRYKRQQQNEGDGFEEVQHQNEDEQQYDEQGQLVVRERQQGQYRKRGTREYRGTRDGYYQQQSQQHYRGQQQQQQQQDEDELEQGELNNEQRQQLQQGEEDDDDEEDVRRVIGVSVKWLKRGTKHTQLETLFKPYHPQNINLQLDLTDPRYDFAIAFIPDPEICEKCLK